MRDQAIACMPRARPTLPSPLQAMVSGATSTEDLRRQVQGMPLREMRTQLVSRGLGTSGTRMDLEERLYAVLVRESAVSEGNRAG